MNHFDALVAQLKRYVLGLVLLSNSVAIGLLWLSLRFFHLSSLLSLGVVGLLALLIAIGFSVIVVRYVSEPIRFLWQAVLYVSPEHVGAAAPNLDRSRIGHELVNSLVLQIYQLASHPAVAKGTAADTRATTIANNLPFPLLVMDKQQVVIFANQAALTYLQLPGNEIIGKLAYDVLDLSFPTEQTFETWLSDAKQHKLTASQSWEHIRVKVPGQNRLLQCDLSAYYNKDNPSGVETILALFDRTTQYNQDDQAISFVALTVHELRSPLTVLRGYIEVFDEEFAGKLTPELAGFMDKLQASAQQLAAFVNNILNVARVEADQLQLRLQADNWSDIIKTAVNNMSLPAQAYQKIIESQVDPNLPEVAVDRVSIYEVFNNLLDNAIKYSGSGPKKIIIRSQLRPDGLIETTIQDFGVGIPESVIPHLFEKFYRSHRTQSQVGGTGLGLYLCKAIIDAHGGQIWVQSKPGEGALFGFTLQPYSQMAEKLKGEASQDIVRTAHGWIKNHSLYRR